MPRSALLSCRPRPHEVEVLIMIRKKPDEKAHSSAGAWVRLGIYFLIKLGFQLWETWGP
jgi:hypothetical protein